MQTSDKSINLKTLKGTFVRQSSHPDEVVDAFVAETRKSNRRILLIAILGIAVLLFLVGCTYAFTVYNPVLTVRKDTVPSFEVSLNTHAPQIPQENIYDSNSIEETEENSSTETPSVTVTVQPTATIISNNELSLPVIPTKVAPTVSKVERLITKKGVLLTATPTKLPEPTKIEVNKDITEINLFNIINLKLSK